MTASKDISQLVVYKKGNLPTDEDKGWVIPVLETQENDQFKQVDPSEYPENIYISKGYSEIEKSYGVGELFILDHYHYDEQKTVDKGIAQYFALGSYAKPLKTNTLLPAIESPLPKREDGRLSSDTTLPKGTFFLLDKETYYGPLTANNDGESYIISPKATPAFNPKNDHVALFKASDIAPNLITVTIMGKTHQFIESLKGLIELPYDTYDYISDERLIAHFSKLRFGKDPRPLAKKEAERLQESVVRRRKIQQVPDERVERLEKVLSTYLESTDVGTELVKGFLNDTKAGNSFLEKFIQNNKNDILKKHTQELEETIASDERALKKSLVDIQSRLDSKQRELATINEQVDSARTEAKTNIETIKAQEQEEITRIKDRTEEEKHQLMAQEQASLQEEITKLESNRNQLQTDCDNLLKLSKQLKSFEDLSQEKIILERQTEDLKGAVKSFSATLSDTQKLSEAMTEVKLVTDILNGRSSIVQPVVTTIPPPKLATSQPNSALDLIEKLTYAFEVDDGRPFTVDEMTNLLVSINQSFMTVLCGSPGIGKTSTVTRLAEALHLGGADGRQNFLYTPVGRGWVSSRDIIGFYNSIKGIFQPARTGLYDFLRRGSEKGYDASPRIILLDEANLSSLEHYWSDFLGMCDPEGRSRLIDTGYSDGEAQHLTVGSNVRFIATINNDSTTERLSPRMIDRVPVITLGEVTISESGLGDLTRLNGAIEYSLFESMLSPTKEPELSPSDQKRIDKIIDILGSRNSSYGQPINISPRKRIAITNYCSIASSLLQDEEAIDFAISQHILPHIEGFGGNFLKRLELLQEELSNELPRSQSIVEGIISNGNELTNSYSFF